MDSVTPEKLEFRDAVWFFAGPFIVVGCVWIMTLAGTASDSLDYDWTPCLNHGLGSLMAGWLIGRAASRLQRQIATWSAVASVVLYVLLFLVPDLAYFGWWPARADSPWLIVGLLAVISLAGGLAGAMLAKLQGSADSRRLLWLLLSAAATLGLVVVGFNALRATTANLNNEPTVGMVLAVVAAVIGGGFVTQLLAPHRMVRICGSGGVVFIVLAVERMVRGGYEGGGSIGGALVGAGFLGLLGMLGARLACRVAGRLPARVDEPAMPEATVTTLPVAK